MIGWLTLEEATKRVQRSKATLYRWARSGHLLIIAGRVAEAQLLTADRAMRLRRGRGRARDTPT